MRTRTAAGNDLATTVEVERFFMSGATESTFRALEFPEVGIGQRDTQRTLCDGLSVDVEDADGVTIENNVRVVNVSPTGVGLFFIDAVPEEDDVVQLWFFAAPHDHRRYTLCRVVHCQDGRNGCQVGLQFC